MKTYSTFVEQDPNDPAECVITFPNEILEEAGWSPGDVLIWEIDEQNQIVTIRKKQEKT